MRCHADLTAHTFRARLPSLYSDFRSQRTTNPDGYAANVSAWQAALAQAGQSGLLPSRSGDSSDLLILKTGQDLLQALESKDLGQPLALGAIIVGNIRPATHTFGVFRATDPLSFGSMRRLLRNA